MKVLTAALAAAALAGAAQAGAAPAAGDVAKGRALAQQHCAACHAVGRRGASPNREAPPLRTLGARYPIDSLQEALAEGILVGHPAMPQFAFEPRQIDDLLAYLRSIQPRARTRPPA